MWCLNTETRHSTQASCQKWWIGYELALKMTCQQRFFIQKAAPDVRNNLKMYHLSYGLNITYLDEWNPEMGFYYTYTTRINSKTWYPDQCWRRHVIFITLFTLKKANNCERCSTLFPFHDYSRAVEALMYKWAYSIWCLVIRY